MNDLRFALRQLAKNRGFTAIAVLTLALGIGANTAIFSVVRTALMHPLPYPEPEKLMLIRETHEVHGPMSISWPNYLDWRREVEALEALAVYRRDRFVLTWKGEPEQVDATMVSAGLFDVLAVTPMLGRTFTRDEDRIGGNPVCLLSHDYWRQRFGGDTSIVGRSVELNGRSYAVIGVMPPELAHPSRSDLFVPIGQFSGNPDWIRGNHPGIYGFGRLADGVALDEAQAEIDAIASGLAEEYPETNAANGVEYRRLQEHVVSDVKPALLLLSGAVALVLLIACVNVANLLLVRATGRERELATRTAVGASRGRLVRQLLTESLLLSVMGGLLGVAIGWLGIDALVALYGSDLPRAQELAIDGRVLGFTGLLSLATGVAFGIAPALQSSGGQDGSALQGGGRTRSSIRGSRMQTGLVVAEIALAMMLLVGAGLLMRSFANVLDVKPGLEPGPVLTASVSLPNERYGDDGSVRRFWDRVLERIEALPGASHAAVTDNLPFVGGNQTSFRIAGREPPANGQFPYAEYAAVSEQYFAAMGIRSLRGRVFEERDRAGAPGVMLIDKLFAERYWPDENPIGKVVAFSGSISLRVIGVVDNVRYDGLDVEAPRPQLYISFAQYPARDDVHLVVKGHANASGLIEPVRQAVLSVDPAQPIHAARPYRSIIDDSLADRRLGMSLFGFFAGLSALLATIGIYGVISHAVAMRAQELGVRIALGARGGNVLWLVLRRVALIALAGAAIGAAGALALGSYLRNQLFGVSAHDPLIFTLVPVAIVASALLACLLPAWRAVCIDPVNTLRDE